MDKKLRPQRNAPIKAASRTPLPTLQRVPATTQLPVSSAIIQRAQGDPATLTPSDLQTLQRTIGNRAVTQLMSNSAGQAGSAPPIQAKLKVGSNTDPYEQEANRVARQVVGQIHGRLPLSAMPPSSNLQRSSAKANTVAKPGSFAQGGELSPQIASQLQIARGGGQPLAAPVQSAMEQAFGADFSAVRIHQTPQADTLNRAIEARAFTTGQDLFFRQGEYNPTTLSGQGLLAHELTHVVQQSGGQIQRAQPQRGSSQQATEERLPSRQQVNQSGRVFGQPQIAQRSPQGRIHRCGDDPPKTTETKTLPPVSVKPTTGPTRSTRSTKTTTKPVTKPVDVKSDFGVTGPTTPVSAPPLSSVHSGRDPQPAIDFINTSSLSTEYKERAIVLINNPNEASQGGYGICGLTSVLRAILIHDPVRFAEKAVAAIADVTLATEWSDFFKKNAKPAQKKKELDYIVAQFLLRKGATGPVSQKVLKRNSTGGVDETTKTKDYGDVFKGQDTFSQTFNIPDWEKSGHYATTSGGLNYLYSSVSGREGFKIKISDFGKDYEVAKAKAGPKGTVNAAIKGHDFYQAKGAPTDAVPAEKHPAKYRHWVTIEELEKITKPNTSTGKDDIYFKMKIWTYEKYYEALVNETVVGDYIHSLVVM